MAEILMINLPFAGHTNPTLPLVTALVRNEHKVFYEDGRIRNQCTATQESLKSEITLDEVAMQIEKLFF